MCGIFGAVIDRASSLRDGRDFERSVERLFELSESRGKEAAGLAISNDEALAIYKDAIPASEMLRGSTFRSFLREANSGGRANGLAFIGHSRLVTDGGRELNRNNQPVHTGRIVGIHNGIIVNHAELWKRHHLQRQYDVDSEIIFALLRHRLDRGDSLVAAAAAVFREIEGAASVAALFEDRDQLLLATNNGSLYYRHAPEAGLFVFASERYIMNEFARRYPALANQPTMHVAPGHGVAVNLHDVAVDAFTFDRPVATERAEARSVVRALVDRTAPDRFDTPAAPPALDTDVLSRRFPYVSLVERLRRCRRCVLPETMPYVDFDDTGLCSYCRRYRQIPAKGRAALEEIVAPYRSDDGRPDCIVGVSGGRDSMFGLHYLKVELGMNPVAYTYDWGMVTDLARRNTSRICGRLGIEHILVSADIPTKRDYIRRNVEAWLAKPSLGTIPLFMAGDKHYFYYLNKTRDQVGVKLSFLCENPFERTDFKSGFAGIPPIRHDDDHQYTLSAKNKLKLAAYYGREFLANPRYFNRSLLDTAKAFGAYYVIDHDYHNLYRYIDWNEELVESTLLGAYNFERAEDTVSTWRIGDGTASFYNYIYYAMAGLTENDTFRSNQIREGVMTRERALELIDRDNRPRFASIEWYLRTIGLAGQLENVLARIESAPKRHADQLRL